MTLWLLLGLFILFSFIAGGKHAVRTLLTLAVNLFLLYLIISLMTNGFHPIVTAVIGCLVITAVILFFNCGVNAKTLSSFLSVLAVLILQSALILFLTDKGNLGGFGFEDLNDVAGFSYDIGIRVSTVAAACMLVSLIGAVTETAIAVSTVVFEVKENNPDTTFYNLYLAGLCVGKDIIGTTVNTLYFAFLGEAATLILWYHIYDYSWWELLNSTVFCREFIKICFSALGCVLIMPLASLFSAAMLVGPLQSWPKKARQGLKRAKEWLFKDDFEK